MLTFSLNRDLLTALADSDAIEMYMRCIKKGGIFC